MLKKKMIVAALVLAASWAGHATASSDQVREFAATIACSQMPLDACTWLDTENYSNLRDSYKAQLRQKFCGTGNINTAKQMAASSEPNEYPNPECSRVLKRLNEF